MTKHTILGRVALLARTDPDALLDQAQDPQKMVDQLIREYAGTVDEAEAAVSRTLAEQRLTEHDHAQDVAAAAEWGAKAVVASRKADELRAAGRTPEADRFDHLARIALGRQVLSERESGDTGPVLAAQREAITRLRAGLTEMKERLTRLRERRDAMVAMARSPQGRERLPDAIRGVDVLDPAGDLSRFENKVHREEARTLGREELPESVLDALFESLDPTMDPAEVDTRLAHLKSPVS